MTGALNDFPFPPPVRDFLVDVDAFYDERGPRTWRGTPESAARFRRHMEAMLPYAEAGDVAAQYALAMYYLLKLGHASEAEASALAGGDAIHLNAWLTRAAAAGHLGALDNLLEVGTGPEAERIRALYKAHRSKFTLAAPPSADWRQDMEILYSLAYGPEAPDA